VPHSCDFSLHLGGWGRESLPGTGGGIGDASQARGQGDGNFGKGNPSPAWGAELGIPPRLGTWDISPAREAGRPMESSNLPEHVFSNLCRAPIQLVICDGRRSLLARRSPSPVCDRLLARQGLLFDDGCRNIARASTSGTSTSNRGISSSTQGTWTSTRGPRHRFRKHRPRPRVISTSGPRDLDFDRRDPDLDQISGWGSRRPTVVLWRPCPARALEQGSPPRRGGRSRNHLPGEGVGAGVTSPARGLEQGSPPR
jgi:hypothetical protein